MTQHYQRQLLLLLSVLKSQKCTSTLVLNTFVQLKNVGLLIKKKKKKNPFAFRTEKLPKDSRNVSKNKSIFNHIDPPVPILPQESWPFPVEIKILKFLFIESINSWERNDTASTANLQTKELDGEKVVLYPVNCHTLHANCKINAYMYAWYRD